MTSTTRLVDTVSKTAAAFDQLDDLTHKALHIAWLTPLPTDDGGVTGVAADLLDGLAKLGHHIDCFIAGNESPLPARLAKHTNLNFVWAGTRWEWGRWYSRTSLMVFISGLVARAWAFLRTRRQISHMHKCDPYDVIYQFSNIETVGIPKSLASTIPVVIHPETHIAGELHWLRRERHLAHQCEPWHRRVLVELMLIGRSVIQRRCIHAATLVICISNVFREHIVADYKVPRERTRVIPNPVRLDRFEATAKRVHDPPIILVLGRISVRKGVDQVIELSHLLAKRKVNTRIRIVGGQTLWSDYRPLLRALHPMNTECVDSVPSHAIPCELNRCDMLLQASKYEPFGLTVAEALAAGVPVVATVEVGAAEGVSPAVAEIVPVGDAELLADAVERVLARLSQNEVKLSALARQNADRLFSPETVSVAISNALAHLVDASEVVRDDHVENGPVAASEMGAF